MIGLISFSQKKKNAGILEVSINIYNASNDVKGAWTYSATSPRDMGTLTLKSQIVS